MIDTTMDLTSDGWPAPPTETADVPVPPRYFGVWSRKVLETPTSCDTTSYVRWLQLGLWHADLRVPINPQGTKEGFSGITKVTQTSAGEVCSWLRLVDCQPPRATPDEGLMVFETPQRLIETGIHGVYHEVWERLPESLGAQIALAEPLRADGLASARLFVSGSCVMRVRPRTPCSDAFEISFARYSHNHMVIENSTLDALVGQTSQLKITRLGPGIAEVDDGSGKAPWTILEWR